jgi:hypothetical protein
VELVASGEMLQKIAGGGNELILEDPLFRFLYLQNMARSLFIVFILHCASFFANR